MVLTSDYEYYNYEKLRIAQNAKKPFSTHLIWEHSTYGLIFVDSTDQTVLLITTDEGITVTVINISDNTNSYKIQAGVLVGNDLWLVMCDNPGNDFEVCFIELDDSNDCNPVDVSAGGDAGTVYAIDIFDISGTKYVTNDEQRTGSDILVCWDVDVSPFVEKDTA